VTRAERPAATNAGGGESAAAPSGSGLVVPFRDRPEAGRALALRLRWWAGAHPMVLGIPRGGMVVADPVAQALDAPLDAIVAVKLRAPGNPELAIGALAEGGVSVLDVAAPALRRATPAQLEREALRASGELRRRVALYRGDRAPIALEGRTVVVVDDGLATGATARAALRAVRAHHPRTVVLAVPVGAPDTVAALAPEADHVVCPARPDPLTAVGAWYEDFRPTSDAEVVRLLAATRHRGSAAARYFSVSGAGQGADAAPFARGESRR
jgi:predicted phosphoribosyltransferase